MADIVEPAFPQPPWELAELVSLLRDLHAKVSKMPELMVSWDLSEGQMLPGKQVAATTSQIFASLTNMISGVENFVQRNPVKRVANTDRHPEFWLMLTLAEQGVLEHSDPR